MNRHPDNSDDIIDSREVNRAIEELETELEEDPDDEDVQEELTALRDLRDEGESATSEWDDGATLIRDSYFKDYAMELADDIGAIDKNAGWPLNCIDWDQAARDLQMDYTSIEFDGVDYWVRS